MAQRGGAARHGPHWGVLVLPLERRGVCVLLCHRVIFLCMHAYTVEPFNDLPLHFPALAPHRYGDGRGVAASKEPCETVVQVFFFFLWEGLQIFLIELLYTRPPFLSLFTYFQPHWRECFPVALHLVKRRLLLRLCSQSIIIWIWGGNITTHRPKWSITATLLI